MSKKKAPQPEEATSTDDWIVTFSDCMTLLLCFFVMLMSFSTFDDQELVELANAFDYKSQNSISDEPEAVPESLLPAPETIESDTGSTVPTVDENEMVDNPKQRNPLLSTDAFRDRRVFRMPSSRLFWAQGVGLTPAGKGRLKLMGDYMHLLPCRVIVSENSTGQSGSSPDQTPLGLKRSMAIVDYFTQPKPNGMGLPVKLFSITNYVGKSDTGNAMVNIALLARSKHE